MKIIFIGAVQFSASALKATIESGMEIVGVCTLADSKFNADHEDLEPIAQKSCIPSLYVDNINCSETIKWIREKKPDVIFCFGWSKLLGDELLGLPPMGVIGYHPAALPLNRGRHPLVWSLALGLKETASTFFFMDKGADSGDILSQGKVIVTKEDNASSLYGKISAVALDQIREFIPLLKNDSYQRIPQNHSQASYWRKRGLKDGQIDWRMPANGIYNLIRALSEPYVGAHFIYRDKMIKVWDSVIVDLLDVQNIEAGKVLSKKDNGITIKCGEQCLTMKKFDPFEGLQVGDYL